MHDISRYSLHRENGLKQGSGKELAVRENTVGLEILPKHRENTWTYVYTQVVDSFIEYDL